MQRLGLRELMLGTPLGDRAGEAELSSELDRHLRGLLELITRVYGDSEAARQAAIEMRRLLESDDVQGKRAAVLYSLFLEPDVQAYWASTGSAQLSADLAQRVLPFITPLFFKHNCQAPAGYALFATVLAEMWAGETLGNWRSAP